MIKLRLFCKNIFQDSKNLLVTMAWFSVPAECSTMNGCIGTTLLSLNSGFGMNFMHEIYCSGFLAFYKCPNQE